MLKWKMVWKNRLIGVRPIWQSQNTLSFCIEVSNAVHLINQNTWMPSEVVHEYLSGYHQFKLFAKHANCTCLRSYQRPSLISWRFFYVNIAQVVRMGCLENSEYVMDVCPDLPSGNNAHRTGRTPPWQRPSNWYFSLFCTCHSSYFLTCLIYEISSVLVTESLLYWFQQLIGKTRFLTRVYNYTYSRSIYTGNSY